MSNDTRELPAARDGLTRFLGGSPLAVAFRLVLLSILVGVVLAAVGFARRLVPAQAIDARKPHRHAGFMPR